MKRSRKLIAWGVTALILVAGIWVWKRRSSPTAYYVYPKKKEVIALVIATGRIRASQQSTLLSEISAMVKRLPVDEGDKVQKGQLLVDLYQAEMESRLHQAKAMITTAHRVLLQTRRKPLQSEFLQAQADHKLARSKYQQARLDEQRARRLYRKRTISRSEYDRALFARSQSRALLSSAKARWVRLKEAPRKEDVALAQARLREAYASYRVLLIQSKKQHVRAPFSGVIVSRNISVGQTVQPNTSLITLADPTSLEVYAETDENNLGRIRVGQPAQVIATAYPGKPFAARVDKISPAVDNKRGVIGLRLKLLEKLPTLRFDLTVDVNIEVQRWPQAWSVPREAMFKRGGRPFLLVLNRGVTQWLPVNLLGSNMDRAVLKHIVPTTQVLLRAQALGAGKKVRPLPYSKAMTLGSP